jgi:hypothetical protein
MFRKHLSYANVIASIALFIALGGSAVAAATLNRDSVGAPQIRKDAVRSPEIQKDSVRSSEIRDEDIKLADIGDGARDALLGDVEVRERDDLVKAPVCNGTDPTACPNLLALRLNTHDDESTARGRPSSGGSVEPPEGRNWLVQAKLGVENGITPLPGTSNQCGLVLDSSAGQDSLLDRVPYDLNQVNAFAESEAIALTTVFSDDRFENPRIALRCTAQANEFLEPFDMKITALEVGKVIGP